jgi:hypothetical protein
MTANVMSLLYRYSSDVITMLNADFITRNQSPAADASAYFEIIPALQPIISIVAAGYLDDGVSVPKGNRPHYYPWKQGELPSRPRNEDPCHTIDGRIQSGCQRPLHHQQGNRGAK